MKGSSGSQLTLEGDYLRKKCQDAEQQVRWFSRVKDTLLPAFTVPEVNLVGPNEYLMEFYSWPLGTQEASTWFINTMVDQIMVWSNTPTSSSASWLDYLDRLEEHVRSSNSESMRRALRILEKEPDWRTSFCHGDFTLENVLVNDQRIAIIDPNNKSNLFQSFVLDLGKMLQSTEAGYHSRFQCNDGVSLRRHTDVLLKRLTKEGLLREARVACLSHIVRLRKYRPPEQTLLVDQLLDQLTKNLR
jgi:hypothetical protein